MKPEVKRRKNSDAVRKPPCKENLPFSEIDLLKDLDAHGAHADELALPSASEVGD
jgi:antitoxin MazE